MKDNVALRIDPIRGYEARKWFEMIENQVNECLMNVNVHNIRVFLDFNNYFREHLSHIS